MHVRLTANRALLISYDAESDSWVTLEGMPLCVLSHPVDFEPGVTMQHVVALDQKRHSAPGPPDG